MRSSYGPSARRTNADRHLVLAGLDQDRIGPIDVDAERQRRPTSSTSSTPRSYLSSATRSPLTEMSRSSSGAPTPPATFIRNWYRPSAGKRVRRDDAAARAVRRAFDVVPRMLRRERRDRERLLRRRRVTCRRSPCGSPRRRRSDTRRAASATAPARRRCCRSWRSWCRAAGSPPR